MEVMDAHSHRSIDLSSSSHIAIVVMEFVLFVATNIEPPYVFPHAFVYDGTVSVVATLGIIKVATIALFMNTTTTVERTTYKYDLYHSDAAGGN